jgi:hypothetical protein
LRFNSIKSQNKDLMMNNFIKQLPSKKTLTSASLSLVNITKNFSPIILTTLQLAVMLTAMMITLPTLAIEVTSANKATKNTIKSYSKGQMANSATTMSKEGIFEILHKKKLQGDTDQKLNKLLNATRDDVIAIKHQQAANISANLSNQITNKTPKRSARKSANDIRAIQNLSNTSRSVSDGRFVIYEGYSSLIEDYDGDGYYQTFSVTFDADLVTYYAHEEAVVYAELYLSENGGPWEHYYSTDSFVIHGESTDDEFEVYSTLAQGFTTNHYDVLIDLYEEGYPNIVASYSSDDSSSLYGLPLESSGYDLEYVEYYEEATIHGGSTSNLVLIIIFGIIVMRYFDNKQPCRS